MSKLQAQAEALLESHNGNKDSALRALTRVAATAAFVVFVFTILIVVPLFFIDAPSPDSLSNIVRILIGLGILLCLTLQLVSLSIIVYSLRIKAIIYKL